MSPRPTALVLRALGLGDFLTGLPALAMLRAALPEHRIVLAAPRAFAPLTELAGTVDALVHGHELDPLVDPPRRPELAVDLHGNGPASRQLLLDCEPARLLAFDDDDDEGGGAGGPRWRRDEHEVRRWCRLISEGLPAPDLPEPSVVGALPVPPGAAPLERATILHCGAKASSRRWPPERFAALAILLRARGHEVVITGGAAERHTAHRIGAAAGVPVLADLDLLDLLRLVAAARLVVCGDTGVGHVASNYATPSVLLFGPVSPHSWGPPAHPRHQVLWHGSGDGDPHGDTPDPALLAIRVAEAAAAVDPALAGTQAPAPLARGA